MAFALMQAWEMPRKSNITKQNKKLQWATVFGLYSGLMYDFWAIQKQKVRITKKKKLESANTRCLYISPDVLCNIYQLCKKRVAWIEFKKANRTSVCQCGLPPMVLMHLDEPCKGKVDMTEQQNINRRYPHTNEDNMLRQVMEKSKAMCKHMILSKQRVERSVCWITKLNTISGHEFPTARLYMKDPDQFSRSTFQQSVFTFQTNTEDHHNNTAAKTPHKSTSTTTPPPYHHRHAATTTKTPP